MERSDSRWLEHDIPRLSSPSCISMTGNSNNNELQSWGIRSSNGEFLSSMLASRYWIVAQHNLQRICMVTQCGIMLPFLSSRISFSNCYIETSETAEKERNRLTRTITLDENTSERMVHWRSMPKILWSKGWCLVPCFGARARKNHVADLRANSDK
jgi:hypothetical protein